MVHFVGFCLLSPSRHPHFESGGRILALVTSCLGAQWALLCRGLFYHLLQTANDKSSSKDNDLNNGGGLSSSSSSSSVFHVGVHDLSESLLAAVSLQLAFGPFSLGQIAPTNLILVTLVHIPAYTVCRCTNTALPECCDITYNHSDNVAVVSPTTTATMWLLLYTYVTVAAVDLVALLAAV